MKYLKFPILFFLFIQICSCSIEKRHYLAGHHLNWFNHKNVTLSSITPKSLDLAKSNLVLNKNANLNQTITSLVQNGSNELATTEQVNLLIAKSNFKNSSIINKQKKNQGKLTTAIESFLTFVPLHKRINNLAKSNFKTEQQQEPKKLSSTMAFIGFAGGLLGCCALLSFGVYLLFLPPTTQYTLLQYTLYFLLELIIVLSSVACGIYSFSCN